MEPAFSGSWGNRFAQEPGEGWSWSEHEIEGNWAGIWVRVKDWDTLFQSLSLRKSQTQSQKEKRLGLEDGLGEEVECGGANTMEKRNTEMVFIVSGPYLVQKRGPYKENTVQPRS